MLKYRIIYLNYNQKDDKFVGQISDKTNKKYFLMFVYKRKTLIFRNNKSLSCTIRNAQVISLHELFSTNEKFFVIEESNSVVSKSEEHWVVFSESDQKST